MTIPFLNLFKRKPAKETLAAASVVLSPVEKPSSDRLSKTVLPKATRTVSGQDPFQTAPQSMEHSASLSGTIAFSSSPSATRPGDLPPAVALALEPKVERVISLELSEVLNEMPDGWIRPVQEAEASRRVLLKAAEIEKGMSTGRPSVSIASIYRQVPEIFVRPVPDCDNSQVQLPLTKVMEQFTNLQLRGDQYRDQTVPQLETPFLKVTLEDNSRFGTTMAPVETGVLPPIRMELATAETLAAAEPEPAGREKIAPTPFPTSAPVSKTNGTEPKSVPSTEKTPTSFAPTSVPRRIPFKLSPTGSDAPATERVPASGGPSVPTSLSTSAPTRIAFKMTAPSDDLRAKAEPWLTKENFGTDLESTAVAAEPGPTPEKEKPVKSDLKISLPLKPILQALQPFQLTGDINGVPDEARLELPFSLVEPQLVSGRVTVKPDEFAAALPEEFKGLFSSKEIAAPVALPLQEVLKNLPAASLRMRDDQEEEEKGSDFATPFSAKAEEDAKRFNMASTTVVKPLKGPAKPAAAKPAIEAPAPISTPMSEDPPAPVEPQEVVEPTVVPAPEPAPPETENTEGGRSALQTEFDTDEELDAKAVVAHVGKMAGVEACAIMFGDGLSLAGNLPEAYAADGLCAMAPSLLQKIENHMVETKLGAFRAMTLSCAQAAITFFMHDNLCLAALHSKEELAADIRERLARAVHELSRKYSHPV